MDVALYLAFTATILTGLAAWLVVPGSPPVLGPAVDGVAPATREPWVDGHLVAGRVALAATVHHVAGRWKWIVRAIVPAAGRSADRKGR